MKDLGIGSLGGVLIVGGGGNGLGVLEGAVRAVPVADIRERLDSALDYPQAFRSRGFSGTVDAEIAFGADGRLLPSKARALSNYLRVHVLRVIRSAFSEGVPATYVRGQPLRLFARFAFVLSDGEQQFPTDAREWGKTLYFSRVGRKFGEWKLGPLRGVWFAPEVAVDLEWIGEKVGKAFSRKAEIDPLETYRRDPQW